MNLLDLDDYVDWLLDLKLERDKLALEATSSEMRGTNEYSDHIWSRIDDVERRIEYVNERIRELEGEVE